MIKIKYIIPINNNSRLNQLKQDINLLLKLSNVELLIEEIDFSDSTYTGVNIFIGGTNVYSYFDTISNLPYLELKDYFLRLTQIALDITLNYKKALKTLDLPQSKHFLKLETVLTFIQNQY